jgi:flagellar hook-associated protein 1 FlgK
MSGLLDSLNSAVSGLTAARVGLDVVGQNMANVNTDGYARRTIDFAETPPVTPLGTGSGVTVEDVRAERDEFVESRLRQEQQGSSYDDAVVWGLTDINGAIGQPGSSLDAQISSFFDAFSTLADDPTSTTARDTVAAQGGTLAAGFQAMASTLDDAQHAADTKIAADLDQVNQLAGQVADLNRKITDGGPDVESLRDARNLALTQLSSLAGVSVTTEAGGAVDVTIGQGRPLVIGTTAYTLTTSTTPPSGLLSIVTDDRDITSEITGGEIGGLLQVRDTLVPSYQGRLDQLAYDLATQVNAIHQTGFDASGAAAGNFFTPPASVSGAAAALSVDPAVAADSSLVAASGTGSAGDNQIARAIAQLRTTRSIAAGSMTPLEAWGQLAYHVGADVSAAQSSSATHAAVLQQLGDMQASVSGVSLDEEAANLMKFQRAYEANARYFSSIVDTLDTLMSMVQ